MRVLAAALQPLATSLATSPSRPVTTATAQRNGCFWWKKPPLQPLLLTFPAQDQLTLQLEKRLGLGLDPSNLWDYAQTGAGQLGLGQYHRRVFRDAAGLLMSPWGEGSKAVHYLTFVNGVAPSSTPSSLPPDLTEITAAFKQGLQGEVMDFSSRRSTGSPNVLADATYIWNRSARGRDRLIWLLEPIEVAPIGEVRTVPLPQLVHLKTLTRQNTTGGGNGRGGLRLSYQA